MGWDVDAFMMGRDGTWWAGCCSVGVDTGKGLWPMGRSMRLLGQWGCFIMVEWIVMKHVVHMVGEHMVPGEWG